MKPFKNYLHEVVSFYDADNFLIEKNIADLSPEEHKRFRQTESEAEQWHKDHPIHHSNIEHHYNQATHDEKHAGHTWYGDAHHMAKTISHDTKTPLHTTAGLISNYSPQTHWHTNIMTASKVAREKKAMGGKGSGVFADERQKHAAHRMLSGEHYDHVLTGQKTHAFAHLIEHGGNKDKEHPKVVVDRHAYSVAAGHRINDAAFGKTNLKSKKGYKHVADAYHKAAKNLSDQHGHEIHPHQVQATTWLVRQRLNSQEDNDRTGTAKRGAQKNAHAGREKWNKYAHEHHPSIVGKEPGTGYDKKNEELEEMYGKGDIEAIGMYHATKMGRKKPDAAYHVIQRQRAARLRDVKNGTGPLGPTAMLTKTGKGEGRMGFATQDSKEAKKLKPKSS